VLVLHVPLEVELFKLCEPAEAEQTDDLPPEVVAEVALGPDPLEGAAVANAVCNNLKKKWAFFVVEDALGRNLVSYHHHQPISMCNAFQVPHM
jgi:hypothetical protein